MNPNDYPQGSGLPPGVKVGLSKHAVIDICLGVLSLAMAIPSVYLLMERGELKRVDQANAAANTALLSKFTNAFTVLYNERQENVRHVHAMASAVRQFLTNEHISELEIAPERVSFFRTNHSYANAWTWEITPSNVVARKVFYKTNAPAVVALEKQK